MTDYPKFLHLGRIILIHHSKNLYLHEGWPISWPDIVNFAQEVLEHHENRKGDDAGGNGDGSGE